MNLIWRQKSYKGVTLRDMAEHFCAEHLFLFEQVGPAEIVNWIENEKYTEFIICITSNKAKMDCACKIKKEGVWYNVYRTSALYNNIRV